MTAHASDAGSVRLATFGRGGRGACELRVTLDSLEGARFVSLRLWDRGRDGVWRPSTRGVTVRLRELDEVLAALARARDITDSSTTGQPRTGVRAGDARARRG